MLKGLGIIAAVVLISASPVILKSSFVKKSTSVQKAAPAKAVSKKIEELLPIPGDTPYGQNCSFTGVKNGDDIWECYPNGKNEDPNEVLAGIAIDQLPSVVVETWAKSKD